MSICFKLIDKTVFSWFLYLIMEGGVLKIDVLMYFYNKLLLNIAMTMDTQKVTNIK